MEGYQSTPNVGSLKGSGAHQQSRASAGALQLSCAIGVARPLSIYVDTHGTGEVPPARIEEAVARAMDLTPSGIRDKLELNRPIFQRTAAYCHFGREPDGDGGFSWEKTDLVDALKAEVTWR